MKRILKRLWEGWKKVAIKIGRFQTMIIVSLFYLLVISPLGLTFRLFGWDPLDGKKSKQRLDTNWKPVERKENDLASIKRQS